MQDYSEFTITLYDKEGKPHQVPVSALGLTATPTQPQPEQPAGTPERPEPEHPAPKPEPEENGGKAPGYPEQLPGDFRVAVTRIGNRLFMRTNAPVGAGLVRVDASGKFLQGAGETKMDPAPILKRQYNTLALFDNVSDGQVYFLVVSGKQSGYVTFPITGQEVDEKELTVYATLAEALESVKPRVAGIGDIFVTKPS